MPKTLICLRRHLRGCCQYGRRLHTVAAANAHAWLPPGHGLCLCTTVACEWQPIVWPPCSTNPMRGLCPSAIRRLDVGSAHAQSPMWLPVHLCATTAHARPSLARGCMCGCRLFSWLLRCAHCSAQLLLSTDLLVIHS